VHCFGKTDERTWWIWQYRPSRVCTGDAALVHWRRTIAMNAMNG